jgi:hypothetical protein
MLSRLEELLSHLTLATRESANRSDIKITITPVAKATRLANKRRIGRLP